jgi:hypothetical protein
MNFLQRLDDATDKHIDMLMSGPFSSATETRLIKIVLFKF